MQPQIIWIDNFQNIIFLNIKINHRLYNPFTLFYCTLGVASLICCMPDTKYKSKSTSVHYLIEALVF